jgi:hypothetical protein
LLVGLFTYHAPIKAESGRTVNNYLKLFSGAFAGVSADFRPHRRFQRRSQSRSRHPVGSAGRSTPHQMQASTRTVQPARPSGPARIRLRPCT